MRKMKKAMSILLAIALVVSTWQVASQEVQATDEVTCEKCGTVYENGFCTCANTNGYQPAEDTDGDGYYEIGNAGQLYWFAAQVNSGNTTMNVELVSSIVVNDGDVEGCQGTKDSSWRDWTPIGNNAARQYAGIFDGASYQISGLYFNKSSVRVGLFGQTSGTIQNVGVVNSYFAGASGVAAISGYIVAGGKISNSYASGTVKGASSVAGICGNFTSGTVEQCYFEGSVSGTGVVGGICGTVTGGTISKCYNASTVTSTGNYVGGICGTVQTSGEIKDCYNTGEVGTDKYAAGGVCGNVTGTSKVTGCYNVGNVAKAGNYLGGIAGVNNNGCTVSNCFYYNEGSVTKGVGNEAKGSTNENIVGKSLVQFASGEVAWLLNDLLDDDVWFQNIDNGNAGDASPKFAGGIVYKNQIGGCTDASYVYEYSNTEKAAVTTHVYTYAAEGNVIKESCSNVTSEGAACTHSATATLNVDSSIDTTYTGSSFEPLYVEYSDAWAGSKDLTVTYSNNTNASKEATGTITYEGAEASQTFEIKIATDTLAITNDISKTYDGDAVADVTYTKNGTGTVTVEYKEQGASDDTYTTTKPVDAGEYVVRVSVASDGNYYAISTTKDFEIAQRELTAIVTVKDKDYDGKNTAEIDDVQFDDVVNGDTVNLVGGTATISQAAVGNGLVVSFAGYSVDNDNYILVAQPVDAAINIAQKEITAVITVEDKVYDGNDVATVKNIQLVGVVNGDTVNAVNGTAKFADKNVGSNKTVVFEGWVLDNANYKLAAQPANATADIEQRTLVATAWVSNKIYDGTTTATVAGYSFDDVVPGETVALINGAANFTDQNAGDNKTVVFTNWELDDANYKLAAQPANATANIAQRELVATVTVASKVYDGNNTATINNLDFDAVVSGDVVFLVNGTATFADANVGDAKTVTFAGYAVDNDNYVLAEQPASVTANITAKDLYVVVKVADKQYDGLNSATIASSSLNGLVASDNGTIQLNDGVATFASVRVANDIAINFSDFTISGTNAGNYNLIQPTGIKANIYNNYTAVAGTDYTVTSNDWINSDFVIRANDGYTVSLTDTAEGSWNSELRYTDETAEGSVTFYVKSNATEAISVAATESYKIDKTAPETFDITFNENSVKKFINEVTFGLFYNKNIDVVISAEDALSGVDKVYYYLTDAVLSVEEVLAITDWTEYNNFSVTAEDEAKAVVYVAVIDKAGNITGFASNGATFDLTAPVIDGVEDGATYYVSQNVEATDVNFESLVVAQGDVAAAEDTGDTAVLAGNVEVVYTITATDKAGNETVYTVYMKPIASLLEPIAEITTDNVTSADLGDINDVIASLEALDVEDATEDELAAINEALADCDELVEKIVEVAMSVDEMLTATSEITSENVVLENKDALEAAKQALEDSLVVDGMNLTEDEVAAMTAEVERIDALLTTIANAQAVIDEIGKLPAKDKITLNDEEAIAAARKNYDALTEYEKSLVDASAIEAAEKQIETLKKESPKTYDTAVTSTWMVTLLISAMVILVAIYFERKRAR